jgi:hypothetical protein
VDLAQDPRGGPDHPVMRSVGVRPRRLVPTTTSPTWQPVPEENDGIAFSMDFPDRRHDGGRQAGTPRQDELLHELLLTGVRFGKETVAADGPRHVLGEQIEETAGAVRPFVEAFLNEGFVLSRGGCRLGLRWEGERRGQGERPRGRKLGLCG